MNTQEGHNEKPSQLMLPFIMKELAEMVMKKKALPLNDALHYIYTTRLYKDLLDEEMKLWYQMSLYEAIEKERRKEQATKRHEDAALQDVMH